MVGKKLEDMTKQELINKVKDARDLYSKYLLENSELSRQNKKLESIIETISEECNKITTKEVENG